MDIIEAAKAMKEGKMVQTSDGELGPLRYSPASDGIIGHGGFFSPSVSALPTCLFDSCDPREDTTDCDCFALMDGTPHA